MSQNICALVDLFDKAVAEGARPNTENEVGTLRRQTDRQTDHISIALVGGPPRPCRPIK